MLFFSFFVSLFCYVLCMWETFGLYVCYCFLFLLVFVWFVSKEKKVVENSLSFLRMWHDRHLVWQLISCFSLAVIWCHCSTYYRRSIHSPGAGCTTIHFYPEMIHFIKNDSIYLKKNEMVSLLNISQ